MTNETVSEHLCKTNGYRGTTNCPQCYQEQIESLKAEKEKAEQEVERLREAFDNYCEAVELIVSDYMEGLFINEGNSAVIRHNVTESVKELNEASNGARKSLAQSKGGMSMSMDSIDGSRADRLAEFLRNQLQGGNPEKEDFVENAVKVFKEIYQRNLAQSEKEEGDG